MLTGFRALGSVTGKIAGTSRLYLFTGTLAAVATPKQLQLTSMLVRCRSETTKPHDSTVLFRSTVPSIFLARNVALE